MESGKKVLVYVDDIEKWQIGKLIEQYQIASEGILESWRIEVITGTVIVRYVKNSKEPKEDGCGYLLEKGMEIEAKINFENFDVVEWAGRFYEIEKGYFKNLFADKEDFYVFECNGESWKLTEVLDERNGMLFEDNQLIILFV